MDLSFCTSKQPRTLKKVPMSQGEGMLCYTNICHVKYFLTRPSNQKLDCLNGL